VPTILSITYEISQELLGPLGSNKAYCSRSDTSASRFR